MKKTFSFLKYIILAFSLASCDVGLGVNVDLSGPTIELLAPASRECVAQTFSIKGNAYDYQGVQKVSVTVFEETGTAGNKTKTELGSWIWSGSWTRKLSNESSYSSYANASWVEVTQNHYDWEINGVSLQNATSPNVVIEIKSWDTSGNTSAESVVSRSVIYDTLSPNVLITGPAIKYSELNDIKKPQNLPVTKYQDEKYLSQYINGKFSITGVLEEENSLKYVKIYLKLAKSDNTEVDVIKPIKLYSDNNYKTDSEDVNAQYRDSLRSWEVEIPDLSVAGNSLAGALSGPNYLRIVTESSDLSGNGEGVKFPKGYICYWPEADTPWTECNQLPDGISAEIQPATKINGASIDDDGIDEVIVTVNKVGGTGGKPETIYKKSKDSSPATYQTWTFVTPSEADNYEVQIVAKDINGKAHDAITKKFTVKDITWPSVVVLEPDTTKTLFGDKDGNFNFKIKTLDDTGVSCLKMVFLKKTEDISKLSNSDDAAWDCVSKANPKTTDSNGNIFYYIEPKKAMEGGKQKTEEDETSGVLRKVFVNDLEMNVFKDLGIDGTAGNQLGSLQFLFYVEDEKVFDGDGAAKINKTVSPVAYKGDDEVPNITIDDIEIDRKDGNGFKSYDKLKDSNGDLPRIPNGSVLKVKGTWYDNSMDVWQDTNRFTTLTATYGGAAFNKGIEFFKTRKGTDKNPYYEWEATEEILGDSTSVISLKAEITDYAGKKAEALKAYTVIAGKAEIQCITTSNQNGIYSKGDKISIQMRFNKNVTLEGYTSSPTLTLTNGYTATFNTSSSGTQKLEFIYTVGNSDSTYDKSRNEFDLLDVTGINLNGGKILDAGIKYADSSDIGTILNTIKTLHHNLADNKSIKLFNDPAPITNVEYNETEKILYITFDADVKKDTACTDKITIVPKSFRVPAVVSQDEWKTFSDALKACYTKGTNGASESFTANTEAVYVLNYDLNTDSGTAYDAYNDGGYYKKEFAVTSGQVEFIDNGTGNENRKIKIPLTLPCKGVEYDVSIPVNAFCSTIRSSVHSVLSTDIKPIKDSGMEKPYIRIKNAKATISGSSGNWTIKQPETTEFRIDCETPGASIKYSYELWTRGVTTVENNASINSPVTKGKYEKNSNSIESTSYTANDKITIGKDKNNGTSLEKLGLEYRITADAGSEKNYNVAYRTRIEVDSDAKGKRKGSSIDKNPVGFSVDDDLLLWIRGGTAESGPNSIEGFPVAWSEAETNKLLPLTDWSYCYVWGITANWYPGILEGPADNDSKGNYPGTDSDSSKGPYAYCFAQNSFVPCKSHYPVYPGDYMIFKCGGIAFETGKANIVKKRYEK